jgi:hypothetical protein
MHACVKHKVGDDFHQGINEDNEPCTKTLSRYDIF